MERIKLIQLIWLTIRNIKEKLNCTEERKWKYDLKKGYGMVYYIGLMQIISD